jgi:hypothetical protein
MTNHYVEQHAQIIQLDNVALRYYVEKFSEENRINELISGCQIMHA